MNSESLNPAIWRNLRLFIFDLDGTLIDSKRDLVEAVNATRAHYGLGRLGDEQVASLVGQGAPVLVRRALELAEDDALADEALAFFYAYYREHMLDHTLPYPGVRDGLEQLAGDGRILTVLTNKTENFTRRILEGLNLAGYFRLVYGANSFERKKPDPMGTEAILRQTGVGKERTLLVGDSETDVLTARNAGVRVCGVTYGFGSHLLDAYPPDLRINSLTELAALVCG